MKIKDGKGGTREEETEEKKSYEIHSGAKDEDEVLIRDSGGRGEEEVSCGQVKDGKRPNDGRGRNDGHD